MTLQNVRLFEQVNTVQQQWEYTFDSIVIQFWFTMGQGRILRSNQRLSHLLGVKAWLVGRSVTELLPGKNSPYKICPYCEGLAGEGDDPDPWLQGYFLSSTPRLPIQADANWGRCTS